MILPTEYKIIETPCDVDYYKATMKAAVLHWYPDIEVEYAFTCRTPNIDFRPLIPDIKNQIDKCADLRYTKEELDYLAKVPYFKPSYIRYLETERWNPADVTVTEKDGNMDVRVRGPWFHTIDWEIYLLAIISECWTEWNRQKAQIDLQEIFCTAEELLKRKLWLLQKEAPTLKFVDMGTRRRAYKTLQKDVLKTILNVHPDCLAGTSNIHLAKLLNIKAFGTVAHEFDSAHLAFTHPLNAKRMAMLRWLEAFNGDVGIALTDTFTTDHFLTIFDKMLANAYSGVRHDSGPWEPWAEKILAHYEKLGIDPKTKTLTFSDTLTFPRMVEIYNKLAGRAKIGFGIGTDLCNSLGMNWKPLSIVIKMTKCNGVDVLKLSDDISKKTCENPILYEYLKSMFCK